VGVDIRGGSPTYDEGATSTIGGQPLVFSFFFN
jgi:hypothetical protein